MQASQIVSSPSLVQAQLLASFQIAQAESLAQSSFAVGAVLSMSDAKEVVVYVNGTLIGTSVAEASHLPPDSQHQHSCSVDLGLHQSAPQHLLRPFLSGFGSEW